MNSQTKKIATYLSVLVAAGAFSALTHADQDPDLDLTLTVLEQGQKPTEVFNEISLPEIQPSAELKHLNNDIKKRLERGGTVADTMDHPSQRRDELLKQNRDQILDTPDVANNQIPVFVTEKANLREEFLLELHDFISEMSKGKGLDETKVKDLVKQWKEQLEELKTNNGKGKNK